MRIVKNNRPRYVVMSETEFDVMMSDLGPRGVFYRVRVGSFATEGEAEKSLEAVSKDFKSGIIVAE